MTVDAFEALQKDPAKWSTWQAELFAKNIKAEIYVWTDPKDKTEFTLSIQPIIV
jgi:hypothetical protein